MVVDLNEWFEWKSVFTCYYIVVQSISYSKVGVQLIHFKAGLDFQAYLIWRLIFMSEGSLKRDSSLKSFKARFLRICKSEGSMK